MDGSVIAALILGPLSFAGGLITVVFTQSATRKRDHEADWRKLKLESYTEYFSAIFDAKIHLTDAAARIRYLNAANRLTLVAPPSVLVAFYPYQQESDAYNFNPNPAPDQIASLNHRFRDFIRSIREDCHPPESPKDRSDFEFKLYLAMPPDVGTGTKENTALPKS